MFPVPPQPSTRVEKALRQLCEQSGQAVKPALHSSFKVMHHLTYGDYISLSGPPENIRDIYQTLKTGMGYGEEIANQSLPKEKIGFYASGETPFGVLPPHRQRLVVRFKDLTGDELDRLENLPASRSPAGIGR